MIKSKREYLKVCKLCKCMRVILDTNFVISCIKQKIHFLDEIPKLLPLAEIVVPEQVLSELEKASENKKLKLKDREAAKLALLILQEVKKIRLEKKFVDRGILEYIKKNPGDYVATLDRGLKSQLKNVIIIRGKRRVVLG